MASTSGCLIHSRFEALAAKQPEATAAVCGGLRFSYGELNARANRAARRLIEHDVGAGQFVAVYADRSIDTVAHLLAVAKTGAAYLPLEPNYPPQRLECMLQQAGARHLLAPTDATLPECFAGSTIHRPGDSTSCDCENPPPRAAASDLAYVIFTSGSTGQPKGVLIEHGAVVNTLDDINERFGVGPRDRALCLSSFGFDLSVYDVFGVLGAGGAIVLPDNRSTCRPVAWAQLMADEGVTIWNSVPALMEIFLSDAEARRQLPLPSLRLALLSGDWIAVSLPDRIRRLCPRTRVISLGGATEGSIWSIAYPIGKVDPAWSSVPYGQALRGQSFHVLDEQQRPADVGVTGELYIGGAGVARGYLGRPELTAERFIPDPFCSLPGARLYRTGDLGRWMPDGNIEFQGRADTQVKINGNRVELGEIELALARHPLVREAAVVAPRNGEGRRRLVAFVVPTADLGQPSEPCASGSPSSLESSLRAYLVAKLPLYMLPSRILSVDNLPRSPNGKIDRAALECAASS